MLIHQRRFEPFLPANLRWLIVGSHEAGPSEDSRRTKELQKVFGWVTSNGTDGWAPRGSFAGAQDDTSRQGSSFAQTGTSIAQLRIEESMVELICIGARLQRWRSLRERNWWQKPWA